MSKIFVEINLEMYIFFKKELQKGLFFLTEQSDSLDSNLEG